MATSTNLRRLDGTALDDRLVGTPADELIDGKGGNDNIYGNGGKDLVYGGAGNDRIDCSQAYDPAKGIHVTNTSAVEAHGDEGDDILYGGNGDDLLYGDAGNDELHGMGGADKLYGGDGNDKLWSRQIYDPETKTNSPDLKGDLLDGGNGDDLLYGESGNDTLDGGTGLNKLYGGKGDDLYIIRNRTDYIYDEAGDDSGLIMVDWFKPSTTTVEHWTWAEGVQKLPYWIDALIYSYAPSVANTTAATRTVGFCFAQKPESYFTADDLNEFAPFNSKQVDVTRQVLAYIETVVNLRFVETTDANSPNTIVFGNNEQQSSGGYGGILDSRHGSVVMVDILARHQDPALDGAATLTKTLLHEVGHALGLKHPFSHPDANGNVGQGPYLPDSEEKYPATVMSYSGGAGAKPVYGPLDIAALQYLYGPPSSANTGDSVYMVRADSSLMITDGAGVDTLDASACSVDTHLFLEPGYWGYVGTKQDTITAAGQVTIDFGTQLERAVGGSGSDHISGNDADNEIEGRAGNDWLDGGAGADLLKGGVGSDTLSGGAGNDVLDGGEGRDYARYAGNAASFSITKTTSGWSVQDNKGNQGSDTLAGVERLLFQDNAVALDVDGIAAQAYRLYAAAFDRTPDLAGLGYWLAQMDNGMSLLDVADGFIRNDEFLKLYGATRTHAGFLDKLYRNILHRDPDQKGIAFWAKAMDAGYSEAQILAEFSEGQENVAQVVAKIEHGIAYLPFGMG